MTAGNLADSLFGQARSREAEPLIREALAIRLQVQGKDNVTTVETAHALAMILSAQGKFGEAESRYRECAAEFERLRRRAYRRPRNSVGNLRILYKCCLILRFSARG